MDFFEKHGQLPLPPYINYKPEKEESYQTIFAHELGSVAAPTASLHFTEQVMHDLKEKKIRSHYLTLHVGLGTFKPVDTDDIRDYHMHEETMIITEDIFDTIAREKDQDNNVIAVGTTIARTIETLPYLYKAMGKSGDEYRDNLTKNITDQHCKVCILDWKQEGKRIICQTKIFIYP